MQFLGNHFHQPLGKPCIHLGAQYWPRARRRLEGMESTLCFLPASLRAETESACDASASHALISHAALDFVLRMRSDDRCRYVFRTRPHCEGSIPAHVLNLPFTQFVTDINAPKMIETLEHVTDASLHAFERFLVNIKSEH
jgi:hypothetical protein